MLCTRIYCTWRPMSDLRCKGFKNKIIFFLIECQSVEAQCSVCDIPR